MATLRLIKRRIGAVKSTAKITQAMRMISAARLKRAQRNIESARPYVLKLGDILTNLIDSIGEDYSHPLIEKRKEVQNYVFITIASDRGLCGSFNNNLFRDVVNYIDKKILKDSPDANVYHIAVGKRTFKYFQKREDNIIGDYSGFFSDMNFETAKEMVETAKNYFNSGKADKVYLAFNKFKNVITQEPTIIPLLPVESLEEDKTSEEEKPAEAAEESKINLDYIFEPQREAILDDLLPKYVDIQLWRALLESFAAEQAARMMAMENATNNANELMEHLQLIYNKARQMAITTEMLDIVSGANALRGE